jgi:hypothetical protein
MDGSFLGTSSLLQPLHLSLTYKLLQNTIPCLNPKNLPAKVKWRNSFQLLLNLLWSRCHSSGTVVGFSPRRFGFAPNPAYWDYGGQSFLPTFRFSPLGTIPPVLQIHLRDVWGTDMCPLATWRHTNMVSPHRKKRRYVKSDARSFLATGVR